MLAWRKLLVALGRSALARVDQRSTQMHRLTQAVLRDQLGPGRAATIRALAGTILAANRPGDPGDPVSWPGWAQLMPHILAIDPAASSDPPVRSLAINATWYLLKHGDTRGGHDLARHLHEEWGRQLGSDDTFTLWAANCIGEALRLQGQYVEARRIDEDSLARERQVRGEDHPDTLTSARSLAVDLRRLGEYQAARELDEDTLARRRRILGDDHPDTLPPHATSPLTCGTWGSIRRPASWMRTPWPAAAGSWARTTPTPWYRHVILPLTCGTWGSIRPPGSWTRTPWPAAAGSWARTTPTPWYRHTALPPTCGTWGSTRPPGSWMRTPWPAAAGSSARTTPRP